MTPGKKTPRILLVDDDRDMCESLADVLTLDSSFEVDFCTDPLKAIEKVRENGYSLIILDYKMPNMNGVELIKNIKKIRPDQKVFMFTAFISNELIDQATRVGADKVLSKFIWPDEILKNIKQELA